MPGYSPRIKRRRPRGNAVGNLRLMFAPGRATGRLSLAADDGQLSFAAGPGFVIVGGGEPFGGDGFGHGYPIALIS